MAVNVIISAAGRCPAATGGAREDTNVKKRKIGVCLIVLGGLSLSVSYAYFVKGITNKQDGIFGTVLFEALPWRFMCFGETDIDPRRFQVGRIEGPG